MEQPSIKEAIPLFPVEEKSSSNVYAASNILQHKAEAPYFPETDNVLSSSDPMPLFHHRNTPLYARILPGWKCDIRGIKNYEELPENCRKYIEFIEKEIQVPITMVSNGPGRDDIIHRKTK